MRDNLLTSSLPFFAILVYYLARIRKRYATSLKDMVNDSVEDEDEIPPPPLLERMTTLSGVNFFHLIFCLFSGNGEYLEGVELLIHNISHADIVLGVSIDGADREDEGEVYFCKPNFSQFQSICTQICSFISHPYLSTNPYPIITTTTTTINCQQESPQCAKMRVDESG